MSKKAEWKSNGTDVEKLRIGLNKQAEAWHRPDPVPYAERLENGAWEAKPGKNKKKSKP